MRNAFKKLLTELFARKKKKEWAGWNSKLKTQTRATVVIRSVSSPSGRRARIGTVKLSSHLH